jgi:hypothetical protein
VFDQPGAVAGLGGFAEEFGEALPQLASHSGSLTIGSGSAAPAVDTRRREDHLPASALSTPVSALCCVIRLMVSASPWHPRQWSQPTPKGAASLHGPPPLAENSPLRCLTAEIKSARPAPLPLVNSGAASLPGVSLGPRQELPRA